MRKERNTTVIMLVLPVVFLAASFFLDGVAASAIKSIHSQHFTNAVAVFNKFYFWIYIVLIAVTIAFILKAKTKENKERNTLIMVASIVTAIAVTHVLKLIIQRGRPDGMPFVNPIFGTVDYSFPSGHTTAAAAGAFSAPALRIPWLVFMVVTMFSRVYTNVHFLSDTVGALIVSFAVAAFVKSRLKENLAFDDKLEIRRQAMHCLIGIAIAVFIWKYSSLWYVIFVIAAAGILLSYAIKSLASAKTWMIKQFGKLAVAALQLVERKEELQRYPGKGAILLFVGSGITAAIFGKLAVAAIVILAVGDSVSHLAGRLIGKTKHKWPFIEEKMMEGSLVGFVFAAAAAATVIPVWQAIAASAAGMIVEAMHMRFLGRKVDDNLTVPLCAAAVLWGVRALF